MSAATRYRVGVDIGGTFTDLVLLGSDGGVHTKKVSSSVGNYARAIVEGLVELCGETGIELAAIDEIRHATTVASNAILEAQGSARRPRHDQGLPRHARDPHLAGGNGPLFACGMAAALGMRRVIVPPVAGVFSSFGLICAEVEHHYARTLRRLLRRADPAEIARAWEALAAEARRQLAAEGFGASAMRLRRSAALHYQGQSFELTVPAPDGEVDAAMARHLEEAFAAEHERTYGHRAGPDEPIELVAIQLVGQGLRDGTRIPERVRASRPEPQPGPPRPAYFGREIGWIETPILRRSDLARAQSGPLIVEEYDATCLVPPGAAAQLDGRGNIVIALA